MSETITDKPLKLELPVAAIKQELVPVPAQAVTFDPAVDRDIDAEAGAYVRDLLSISGTAFDVQERKRQEVENLGADVLASGSQSALLNQPLKLLAARADDGGVLANGLLELQQTMQALDPVGRDFTVGTLAHMFSFIPGVGRPVQRYLLKLQSAGESISAIVNSVKKEGETLKRDNATLRDDIVARRQKTLALERKIKYLLAIDKKVETELEHLPAGDQKRFLQEEILFPLRLRQKALLKRRGTNQFGIQANGLVVQNNIQLLEGVNQGCDDSVEVLRVAATLLLALADQRTTLTKFEALENTAQTMLERAADTLQTQGVEVYKQATGDGQDLTRLLQAFAKARASLNEIARYKTNSLPVLKQEIDTLLSATDENEADIRRMERGGKAASIIDAEFTEVKDPSKRF